MNRSSDTHDAAQVVYDVAHRLLPRSVERDALAAHWEATGPLVDSLADTFPFRRIRGVSHLGPKRSVVGVPNSMVPFCGGRTGDVRPLKRQFSRADHSLHVAGTMAALCAQTGMDSESAAVATAGALLHDIGHGVFSHASEAAAHAAGLASHESAGQSLVRTHPDITDALVRFGLESDQVVSVMRERGSLGALQSLADTSAYVLHDAGVCGLPLPREFGQRLVASIVRADESGRLYAQTPAYVMRLVRFRADAHERFYEHAFNRVTSAMLSGVIVWLVEQGRLAAEDIGRETDQAVVHAMRTARADDRAPEWVRDAADVLLGGTLRVRRWALYGAESEEAARALAAAASPRGHALVIPPVHTRSKAYRVRLSDGETMTVRALAGFEPEQYGLTHVLVYAGHR